MNTHTLFIGNPSARLPGPGNQNNLENSEIETDRQGSLGIINIRGPLSKSGRGGTSTGDLIRAVKAGDNDSDISGLLLAFDSTHGGTVAGSFDAAKALASTDVFTIAHGSDALGGTAYLVASQADEVVVNANCATGSVGVVMKVQDTSEKYEKAGIKVHTVSTGGKKGALADGNEITEEALDQLRDRINSIGDLAADLLSARSVNIDEVMTGRVYTGAEAVQAGLADKVEMIDDTISRIAADLTPPESASGARASSNASMGVDSSSQTADWIKQRISELQEKGLSAGAAEAHVRAKWPDEYRIYYQSQL